MQIAIIPEVSMVETLLPINNSARRISDYTDTIRMAGSRPVSVGYIMDNSSLEGTFGIRGGDLLDRISSYDPHGPPGQL